MPSKLPTLPRPGKMRSAGKPKSLAKSHRSPIKASPKSSGPVASHIEAVKYDGKARELTVTYRGGRPYRYADVPQEFADGLEAAESKGRYLSQNGIKQFRILD